jgi:hypothetical protein
MAHPRSVRKGSRAGAWASCCFGYALVIAGTVPPDTTSRVSPESHFPAARSKRPSHYPRPAVASWFDSSLFVICSKSEMNDRPAFWRMPTPKQIEKLASQALRPAAHADPAPDAPLPDEYWEDLLKNSGAAGRPPWSIQQRRFSEIPREVLRVERARCLRCIEFSGSMWSDCSDRMRFGRMSGSACLTMAAASGTQAGHDDGKHTSVHSKSAIGGPVTQRGSDPATPSASAAAFSTATTSSAIYLEHLEFGVR